MSSNKNCSVSRYVMKRALISHYIIMWLMRNDTEFVRIQWRIFDFGGTFVQCRYLLSIKYLLPQYTGRCTQYWGPAVREQANVYIQYQQKRFVFVYLCICVFVHFDSTIYTGQCLRPISAERRPFKIWTFSNMSTHHQIQPRVKNKDFKHRSDFEAEEDGSSSNCF